MTDEKPRLIPFTSRTFVQNLIPHAYPNGARAGYDWETPGGVLDNTDPRNIVYWGPPRPINNDRVFGLHPGETAANCVRRLKETGYIGIYSARAAQEKRDREPTPVPGAGQPSTLERIAATIEETRGRNGHRLNVEARGEGRRATRAEERRTNRREDREAILAGQRPDVPGIAGRGLGYQSEAERAEAEADDFAEVYGTEDADDTADSEGIADSATESGETRPTPETALVPVSAVSLSLQDDADEDDTGDTADDDSPVSAPPGVTMKGRHGNEGSAQRGRSLAGRGRRVKATPAAS
jgi:hypothetical protein